MNIAIGTAHERSFQRNLRAYQRLCQSICQPEFSAKSSGGKCTANLCVFIDKTEQIQLVFSNNLVDYLGHVEVVYDHFWRGPDSLKVLNEGIWQLTKSQYKSPSLPYQLIRLICYKIRHLKLPKVLLSDRHTITHKNLMEFKEAYSTLLAYSGWLRAIVPIFLAEPALLHQLDTHYQQAKHVLATALTSQEVTWQLFQDRMQSFDELYSLVERVKPDF